MDERRGNWARSKRGPTTRGPWRRFGILPTAVRLLTKLRPTAGWRLPAALCLVFLLAAPAFESVAFGQGGGAASGNAGAPVEIQGVRLRKDGEQLRIQFLLSQPTPFEVVGNVPRRVVVVKFRDAVPALSDDRRDIAFNDPYLIGIAFERVGDSDTWAKLRLRTPALSYEVVADAPPQSVVLGLNPAEITEGISLLNARLSPYRGGSRLVLELDASPKIEETRERDTYQIRLQGVAPQLVLPLRAEDPRIAVQNVLRDGPDTLVRIAVKQSDLEVRSLVLPAPSRVVLDFRPPQPQVAAAPGQSGLPSGGPLVPAQPPPSREIPLDVLLERESNPLITSNYLLAEREYQSGNFQRANLLFLRVFDSNPESLLGVRAFFRASDAQYERNVVSGATNYHDVIINYQSAIRSAEALGYETELIARAFFQVGRAYQRMGFHFESNVHYQILQERFPTNFPYTPDSYHFMGLNYLALENFDAAVRSFNEFLVRDGDPELTGPSHYHTADALFSLKRFVEARTEFEKGRRLTADYADSRPLLLFHMGETYYENADFAVARAIYRSLLDRYPEKSYTKLVGLRLGDFLREEGKQDEALAVYRQVIQNAPVEIQLRGKVRIGNVLASRPVGDDYKQALTLYDEVIAEGEGNVVAQEALLRKGLTQTLHGEHQPAIDTLIQLGTTYPDGPFDRPNLIRANIEDNLKSLVDREFGNERFWEVAKLYTRYRDDYFRRFPFPYTVFQVGKAYQRLGLYDESVGLYDEVLRNRPGPLETMVQYQKGLAFFERDNLGAAEEHLLRFIQEHPKDVYTTDARMLLGKVYGTARRYDDALNAYRILAQEFETTQDPQLVESIGEVYFELGQVYKELGRAKEGLDSFQAAVANFHHPIQGDNVPEFVILSHFHIGDMFYELGQDREALEAYEHAIGLYDEHERAPWGRYQMGLIFRRMGDDARALQEFNTLVELARVRPGELWESLARENQRDLTNKLDYQKYLRQ